MSDQAIQSRATLVCDCARLAREVFAERADIYDRDASFPAADFQDLFSAGLFAPAVAKSYGGLGLGVNDGLATLWNLTKELAHGSLALARCWEGHVNSQVLLSELASDEQKGRWFPGIVNDQQLWAAWSGEPQAKRPGQKERIGTQVMRVPGGYSVSGSKVFATSASHARWAILLIDPAGPGGARHSQSDGSELLLLACDLKDARVTFDSTWWDPIGMRASVSYRVDFNDVVIPEENAIGQPGQYLRDGWQTRFSAHYAASFLGAAEAALEYCVDMVKAQGREVDPFVQTRVGEMASNIHTGNLWLQHVSGLFESDQMEKARVAAMRARYVVHNLAKATVEHAINCCGARSLNRPSKLERIFRDLSIYVLHDNPDQVIATIGRQVLGADYDPSFFGHRAKRKTRV